jgi:hypothetical protein
MPREFTFYNVTITLLAEDGAQAYTKLCNGLAAMGGEWTTDTYSTASGHEQPTTELFPPETEEAPQ